MSNAKPFCPENFPYTLVHDNLMPTIFDMHGATVKILLYIMRESRDDFTHFKRIRLSYDQIQAGANVASRTTTSKAIDQLESLGIVNRHVAGRMTGIDRPVYEYELNLDYSPENVPASTESVLTSTKNGLAASTESVLTSTKNGLTPTMTGVVESQPVSQNTEQGDGMPCDHDHERDHVNSKTLVINRLESIGISRGLGNRLVQKMGPERAIQWYAYVIDPENGVKNIRPYLYTSCLENSSEPPIHYDEQEIDRLERQYFRLRADSEMTEPIAPAAPSNNGLAKLWATVLNELKPQIPGAFDNTLAGSMLLAITDGLAMIQVPAGAIEVCDRRLRPVVLRTLSAIAYDIAIQDVKFQEVV